MYLNIFLLVLLVSVVGGIELELNNRNPALDQFLYEDVLDEEQCYEQIRFIRSDQALLFEFLDAGLHIPRGVTKGNTADLGNYFQCLGITRETDSMSVQGKYCTIYVPLSQNWTLPINSYRPGFDPSFFELDGKLVAELEALKFRRAQVLAARGVLDEQLFRSPRSILHRDLTFRLAVCVPKPCSTQQAIVSLLFNDSMNGFQYEHAFCRLPHDKPWSPADTVAVVIFSTIGVLTLLSTSYDLINKIIFQKDPNEVSRLYTSFSVYTNGRRLMTLSSAPGSLHCLDGIRFWAILWVVVGHAFQTELNFSNPKYVYGEWILSLQALWIIAAPVTVDTILCMTGILLVYTSVGKINGVQLLKNLHVFYLNRLLRLWPLLATAVLLQASFLNRISDGPYWVPVEEQTNYCRSHWWVTLLLVQNYVGSWTMCIAHSWYIAIDMQLYIVSPLVLYWVLGNNRKVAWAALVGGLLVHRPDLVRYYQKQYFNTLTRASPFFVGMVFGYLLHLYRGKKLNLSWISAAVLWTCAASISTTLFFYPYFVVQPDWDIQVVDNVMNSYMRAAWAAAVGWMVVACTHGYGGPVNWFLTLDIWKVPARISYAMYIFHFPMMFVISSSAESHIYFTAARIAFKSLAHIMLTMIVAYFATLMIDAPFATLTKMLLKRYKN